MIGLTMINFNLFYDEAKKRVNEANKSITPKLI